MRWVAVVLVVVMVAAIPVSAGPVPVDGVRQEQWQNHIDMTLPDIIITLVIAVIVNFGTTYAWDRYEDEIVAVIEGAISLPRRALELVVRTFTERTGVVCRLARASDGEWVALCP